MRDQLLHGLEPGRTAYETAMTVRPDDLDMFRHVHASKYQDYVLAARFDQMKRCYGISMEAFIEAGYGWYVRTFQIEYIRSLGLGDTFTVRTWIQDFYRKGVFVQFEILSKPREKKVCQGSSHYSLVSLKTQRSEIIPDWIVEKYAV